MNNNQKPALEWALLTQPEFDRLAELLIYREYPTARVEPVDGRGGDGGIDVLKTDADGGRTIFQLKFFLDGFSGKNRGRRRQIRDSLASALTHEPDEWVLVLPSKLTRPDWAFITELTEQTDLPITVWHRTVLDDLLVRHSDVLNLMRREPAAMELLTLWHSEQAALTGPDDLTERTSGLAAVVDAVDPHWTFDFARQGNTVIRTLRGKHATAADVSPVTLRFETLLGPAHADLRQQMDRTIGYGLAGSVTLPSETVKNFRVDGPPLVRQPPRDDIELSWTVPPNSKLAGTPVTVTLVGPDGQHVASHRGTAVDGSPGVVGYSLKVRFHEALTLTYLVPHGRETTCRLDLSWDAGDSTGAPGMLRRAAQLIFDLAKATEMKVALADHELLHARAAMGFALPDAQDWLAGLRDLHDLADDLEAICRVSGDDLPVPTTMTTKERIYLRCARLMLDGHCVMIPDLRSFTFTLKAGLDPAAPGLSQLLNDAEGQFLITQDPWTPIVAGHELHLPQVRMWHPRMRLIDQTKVRRAVIAGKESPARIEPLDGTTFRMFMPSRMSEPEQSLQPVPWNLTNVPEQLPDTQVDVPKRHFGVL